MAPLPGLSRCTSDSQLTELNNVPSESDLRAHLRDLIVSLPGFVTNHEDKFQLGIADTSFVFMAKTLSFPGHYYGKRISGWIELKHINEWPKRKTTLIRLGIRLEQRIWLKRRWKHGEDCMILARIGNDIYLFSGEDTEELYHPIEVSRLEKLWYAKWHKRIDLKELVETICEITR